MNKSLFSSNFPSDTRKPTDTFCILILTAMLLLFFGGGGYVIIQGVKSYRTNLASIYNLYPYIQNQLFNISAVIITMAGLAIKLTFIFFLIIKIFPQVLLYFTMIMTIGTLGTLTILAKIYKYNTAAVVAGVALFLYFIFLFHSILFKLQTASSFIRMGSKILKSNWKVYTIPLVIGLTAFIFTSNFVAIVLSILQLHAVETLRAGEGMLVIGVFGLVYTIFILGFYYTMVFLISSNSLFYHFETNISKSCMGIRWLVKYHLGSITLMSFIGPISKVLQFVIDLISGVSTLPTQNKSGIQYMNLQNTVKGINNCAVSMMVMTGSNLVHSSHLVSDLYSQYPQIHQTARKVNSFLSLSSSIFCVVLPSFLGFILIQKFKHIPIGMFSSIMIVLLSFLSVQINIATLTETISSGLLFAHILRKSNGTLISQVNQQLKQFYSRLFVSTQEQMKIGDKVQSWQQNIKNSI